MSDPYQVITVAGAREDASSILQVMQGIANGDLEDDLKLLNYFQEVPVSYAGTVESVDHEMAEVSVHRHQAAVMKSQNSTFVKSRHFTHDVIAKVFRADTSRCIAFLTEFSYVQVRAERRQFVRVKLHGKVPVTFMSVSGEIKGEADDISIGGICISAEAGTGSVDQSSGVLTVSLDNYDLKIPAMLLQRWDYEGRAKYAFELQAYGQTETKLSQFVFQRQLEIIRELKDGA